MKTSHVVKLAIVFAFLVGVTGCKLTTAQKYVKAEQALTGANKAVTVAVKSGRVTNQDTLKAINATLDEAGLQLDKAHDKIATGQPIDANFYIDAVLDAADRTLSYLAEMEKDK